MVYRRLLRDGVLALVAAIMFELSDAAREANDRRTEAGEATKRYRYFREDGHAMRGIDPERLERVHGVRVVSAMKIPDGASLSCASVNRRIRAS